MPARSRFCYGLARAARGAGLVVAALTMAATLAAAAQDAPPPEHASGARAATRWDLPRIFYDPRLRRSLDNQERAIRLGLGAEGGGTSGPRFDGWLTGPGGTHAWVSGTRYVADHAGRLRAAADRSGQGADGTADALEDGAAQLDRTSGVLVVRRDTEGTLHLRVGEADNPLDPAAAAPAAPAAR